MRALAAILLLYANISFTQMGEFNRLKKAAEISFGYHDKIYPDTFYVQSFRTDTAALYFTNHYDLELDRTKRLAYRRADSSALNGVIIMQQFPHNHTYAQTSMHYENGTMVRSVQRNYYNMSIIGLPANPNLNKQFDYKKYSYSLIRINGGGYQIGFFNKKITSIEYRRQSEDTNESLSEMVLFHANGQLKQYHFNQVKEGIHYENQININENGDTTLIRNLIDYRRYGLLIEPHDTNDLKFKLRTIWENDTLVDVVNTNILFTNHKGEVVSEQVFCSLVHHGINTNHWNLRSIPENIRVRHKIPYTVIISSNLERDFYFLKSDSHRKTDEEVLEAFLKKNNKRIKVLIEN